MDRARLLIGIPAYRGTKYIAETLRSIQEQQFSAFRALISVDNGDVDTADACKPFLSDARFSLIIHDQHLGWAGNINWLMSQEGAEFFCYWQQDDIASRDYLSELVKCADENPSFVCTYSDIQWFGSETVRAICPSVTGFALSRALYFLETMNGVPFRGVIRKEAIDRAGPIRRTELESAQEEFVWLAKLAREGNLRRVEGPVYFKRKHQEALHTKWLGRESSWRRSVWIEFGLGMLEAIWPVVPESEREAAFVVMLERLCCPKEGRFRFYDPTPEAMAFSVEFLDKARSRFQLSSSDNMMPLGLKDSELIKEALGDLLVREAALVKLREKLKDELRYSSSIKLDMRAGDPAVGFLGSGWSSPESWGTWSDGSSATLQLPVPNDMSIWRVSFVCRAFAASTHARTILASTNGDKTVSRLEFRKNGIHKHEILFESQSGDLVINFDFPDAVSPSGLGLSNDGRVLGLGLISVTLSRTDTKHAISRTRTNFFRRFRKRR